MRQIIIQQQKRLPSKPFYTHPSYRIPLFQLIYLIYLERLAPPPAYYLLSSLVSGKTGYLECKNLRDLQGWLKSLESGGQWGISKESSLLGIFRRPWPVCKPDVECLSFRLLRPWRLNLSSMFLFYLTLNEHVYFYLRFFSPFRCLYYGQFKAPYFLFNIFVMQAEELKLQVLDPLDLVTREKNAISFGCSKCRNINFRTNFLKSYYKQSCNFLLN